MPARKIKAVDHDFGSLVRQTRQSLNLSLEEVATAVGCTRGMISKLENGHARASDRLSLQIVELLCSRAPKQDLVEALRKASENLPAGKGEGELDPRFYAWQRKIEHRAPDESEFALALLDQLFNVIEDGKWAAGKYLHSRNWDSALAKASEAQLSWKQLYRQVELFLNQRLSEGNYNNGNYEESIRYQLLTRSLLQQPRDVAQNHVTVGGAYRRLARWRNAIEEYKDAANLLKDDGRFVADCWIRIIAIYNFQGNASEAERTIKKTYKELTPDDRRGLSKLQQHQAWWLSTVGKWDEAIEKYAEARETKKSLLESMDEDDRILEEIKDARYEADAYSNWPDLSTKAADMYNEKIAALMELENRGKTELRLLRGMLLLGRGHSYIEIPGKLVAAQKDLDDCETLFSQLKEPLGKYLTYNEQARLQLKLSHWDQAESWAQLARDGFGEIQCLYPMGAALVNLFRARYAGRDTAGQESLKRLLQDFEGIRNGELDAFPAEYRVLFMYHLSEIQSLAGRAMILVGREEEGADLLCNSLATGLAYNAYVFRERLDELEAQVDEFLRQRKPEQAEGLCLNYLRSSQHSKVRDQGEQREINHSRQRILQKQKEVTMQTQKRIQLKAR